MELALGLALAHLLFAGNDTSAKVCTLLSSTEADESIR